MKTRSKKNLPKAADSDARLRAAQRPADQVKADLAHALDLTCSKMWELANTLFVLEKAVDAALAAIDGAPRDGAFESSGQVV